MDSYPLLNIYPDWQINTFTTPDLVLAVIVIALTAINAIVSGSEVAFFSLNGDESAEIYTDNEPKSRRVLDLLGNPEKLSSALLISFNFLNVAITVLMFYLLSIFFHIQPGSSSTVYAVLVIIAAYILVFIEFIPKTYASQRPLAFVKRNVRLIYVVFRIINPISSLLTKTTNIFSKSSIEKKYEISLDDLSKALELTTDETSNEKEKDMLQGIIRFRDKTVEDILVSRTDMVAIDIETLFTGVVRFIVEAGFSRIPVYEENPDNIKGILYVKDLLPYLDKNDSFRWQSLIRSAYFVPGTKRIDDLLEEFRANKNHMAVVVDEYGGTTGIVTMEDILEEIVGDISDEYDEDNVPFYTIANDGSYIFEGKTSIDDFIEVTGVPSKDFEKIGEEADTLAGLMLELKGDFPKRKELIEYRGYGFQAEEMSKRRIVKIKFIPAKN